MKSNGDVGYIQSVSRAMKLLSLFTPSRSVWSITELARSSGLHKSVVTRLMATMGHEGFVVQDPETRHYHIGPQAFAIGSLFEPFAVLHQLTRPIMADLARRSGHSTALGVPTGNVPTDKQFIILYSIQSNSSIHVAFETGERPYFHAASIGKALLAGMSDDEVLQVLGPDPLPQVTPYTVTSRDQILAEVREIRNAGFSVTREESIVGVGGVAAGVFNSKRECVAAIGLAYPIHIVTADHVLNLGQLVVDAANQVSDKLGAFPQVLR